MRLWPPRVKEIPSKQWDWGYRHYNLLKKAEEFGLAYRFLGSWYEYAEGPYVIDSNGYVRVVSPDGQDRLCVRISLGWSRSGPWVEEVPEILRKLEAKVNQLEQLCRRLQYVRDEEYQREQDKETAKAIRWIQERKEANAKEDGFHGTGLHAR